jgi:hypothetical protein
LRQMAAIEENRKHRGHCTRVQKQCIGSGVFLETQGLDFLSHGRDDFKACIFDILGDTVHAAFF